MSHIAEGFESRTEVQFINFFGMAKASTGEARAQLYVALDQNYIAEAQFKEAYVLAEICARQIAKFISYLETNRRKQRVSDDDADSEV